MTIIILPVKNEAENIRLTVIGLSMRAMMECKDGHKIVIINDGSDYATLLECKKIEQEFADVARITNLFDRGKGSALKLGFVHATMLYDLKPDDIIVFFDGDGQIRPQEISTLREIMNLYNAEAVIGNKRHKYSMTEYTTTRRIISQTYNWIVKILFDLNFDDTQCGIKIFKKRALDKVIAKVNVKQYAFDLELIVALRAIRCRIADAPVTIQSQMNRGSIGIGAIYRTFLDTITIWIKMKKRFYSQGVLL